MTTRLSVNVNKVALLRNQRDIGYPNLLKTCKIILDSGAHGITVHPRPDERHITRKDIPEIAAFIRDYKSPFPAFLNDGNETKPHIEFNIEGYPDEDFLNLVTTHICDQVTLVPDALNQKTSDHGWKIGSNRELLQETVRGLKDSGRRVSLFIDADPAAARAAAEIGADRVELYTGPYATGTAKLQQYIETAQVAKTVGLGINAGHDLNLDNLARFIAGVPDCAEVSIGHAMISDALELGWRGCIAAYMTAIEYGHKSKAA